MHCGREKWIPTKLQFTNLISYDSQKVKNARVRNLLTIINTVN